jgi:hypothetical protein
MFPIVTLSVYHIFAYLSKNFGRTSLWLKYGAGANEWLATRQVGQFPATLPRLRSESARLNDYPSSPERAFCALKALV